jgi:prepilin peptidase CpaA
MNFAIGPPEAGLWFAAKGFAAGFGVYMALYVLRAMGAGDVKLMAAVGALTGVERWFGIFLVTALLGGAIAIIVVALRGRMRKTLFNVGFILSEMGRGRPAYVGREELDVRSRKGISLPHGAVIAVSTVFYLAMAAALSR